jgi:citrate synthase
VPVEIEGVGFLTAAEAALALGVKKETLYAYASRGKLRSYRRGIGRERLYRADEVQELTRLRPGGDAAAELPRVDAWMDGHA